MNPQPVRICTGCGAALPATHDFFHRQKAGKYGLTAICKICSNKKSASWSTRNPDKVREASRRYEAKHHDLRKKREKSNNIFCEIEGISKVCSKCNKVLDANLSNFAPQKTGKLGISSVCRKCQAVYKKAWRERNKENVIASEKRYYNANVEKMKAKNQNFKQSNVAYFIEYRCVNKKKIASQRQAWKSKNPGVCTTYARNYRARKNAALGNHTSEEIKSLYESQDGRCFYCQKDLEGYHVDHKQPLSKGGNNSIDNLAISCSSCNLSKGAKNVEEFMQYKESALK